MTRRLIAVTAAFLAGIIAAHGQPAPGEPPPPPGPVQPPPAGGGGEIPAPGAEPTFGTVALNSDFRPDPYRVEVTAGGPIDASTLGNGCSGWISRAPTFSVLYSPETVGEWPLIFTAMSERADIVLAVREPVGIWHCNDDTEGTDPLVRLENPTYGEYTIWVGTYDVSPDQPATLFISEVVTGWDGIVYPAEEPNPVLIEQEMRFMDMFGEVRQGRVELRTGFQPDPHTLTVTAGGDRPAMGGCPGYNGGPPDFLVAFTAGEYPLIFTTYSDTDTTLMVMGPESDPICVDDTFGHDPLIRIDNPQTGVYAVWIGTYAAGAVEGVRFEISERADLRQ
ncbi:MAG: hypothetical protein AB7O56_08740 [Bauldia sp.]